MSATTASTHAWLLDLLRPEEIAWLNQPLTDAEADAVDKALAAYEHDTPLTNLVISALDENGSVTNGEAFAQLLQVAGGVR